MVYLSRRTIGGKGHSKGILLAQFAGAVKPALGDKSLIRANYAKTRKTAALDPPIPLPLIHTCLNASNNLVIFRDLFFICVAVSPPPF